MKIALYIEDGLEQIVLTPESNTERAILGKLDERVRDFSIKRGSFAQCAAGYVRRYTEDTSTIIVMREKPLDPEPDNAA